MCFADLDQFSKGTKASLLLASRTFSFAIVKCVREKAHDRKNVFLEEGSNGIALLLRSFAGTTAVMVIDQELESLIGL